MTAGVPPGDPGDPADPGELRIERGVAWLRLDDPAHKVNTLSSRLLEWLERQLDRLQREPPPRPGILSRKPPGQRLPLQPDRKSPPPHPPPPTLPHPPP